MKQIDLPGRTRRSSVVAVVAMAALMAACGGGSVVAPPPPPPTPPPPPPPRVVAEGAGSLAVDFLGKVPLTTTLPGRIDATVDWTFATNDVDALIAAGDCTFEQLNAFQCTILASAVSVSTKPEKLSVPAAAAGTYTLFIGNAGPEDESVSFQVVLTPSAGSASVAAPRGQALPEKLRRLKGRTEIH